PAGSAAQLRRCATQIVWRDSGDTSRRGVWPEQLPDDLLAHRVTDDAVAAVNRAEYETDENACLRRPGVNRHFRPCRHWDRADAVVFADEVDDAPTPIPLLNVLEVERGYLRSAQSASEEDGEDRAVSQPFIGRGIRRVQEHLRLAKREP